MKTKMKMLFIITIFFCSLFLIGSNPAVAQTNSSQGTSVAAGDVLMNEFVITPTSGETLELYNTLSSDVIITSWTIWHTTAGEDSALVLMGTITTATTIPANGYALVNDSTSGGNMDSFTLSNAGDTLVLKDNTGAVIDVLAYGSEGGAPAHPFGGSTARVGTGGTNASDWNIDMTETLGAANDASGTNLGGEDVVINEVHSVLDYVELYNTHPFKTIDITGWSISVGTDDIFYINRTVTIEPKSFVVFYDTEPNASASGTYNPLNFWDTNDRVYLYNATGHRVDQMGYASNADPQAWGRYPDGNISYAGANEGWSESSSGFVSLGASPGKTNSKSVYSLVSDFYVNQTTAAPTDTVSVAVQIQLSNGTFLGYSNYSVRVDVGSSISSVLTYDAASGYYNGTVAFTGYTPVADKYGIFHTTALVVNATGGSLGDISSAFTGVLVNPGYTASDTVIMFDEGHSQFYKFSTYYKSGYWSSMLLKTGLADYLVALDTYDGQLFRISTPVLKDVDLLVITDPESDFSSAWLTSDEVSAIQTYIDAGGSLWAGASGQSFSDPANNGLNAIASSWGVQWEDYQYQDSSNSADGQQHHVAQPTKMANGSTFDIFGSFGATSYYHNGIVVNKTSSVAGVTVTEVIAATATSNIDGPDANYDADYSIAGGAIYAAAVLVEKVTGKAYLAGSSSLFGHYTDFLDTPQVHSAQFAFNVFAYLVGKAAVQYPTLKLTDQSTSLSFDNTNSAVKFSVKLSSTLTGVTLADVAVEGDLEGDFVTFSDSDGDGVYDATYDGTALTSGTYTFVITANAKASAGGAILIPAKLTLTLTVTEPTASSSASSSGSSTSTTDAGTSSPGFELISLLFALGVVVSLSHYKRRRA